MTRIPQENDYISNEFEREFNCSEIDSETDLPGACMALMSNNDNVPRGWRQAISIPEWEKVMEKEIRELENKQAWEVVPRPENSNITLHLSAQIFFGPTR